MRGDAFTFEPGEAQVRWSTLDTAPPAQHPLTAPPYCTPFTLSLHPFYCTPFTDPPSLHPLLPPLVTFPSLLQAGGWMVSDVIAYPERVTELLQRWGGNNWADRMVLTMKFQGKGV